MRKRYQEGSVKKQRGVWIAQWWEDRHRRNRTIGRASQMTRAEARVQLLSIITPINVKQSPTSVRITMGNFVDHVYLPFFRRKWKVSTAQANEHRIKYHLLPAFRDRA